MFPIWCSFQIFRIVTVAECRDEQDGVYTVFIVKEGSIHPLQPWSVLYSQSVVSVCIYYVIGNIFIADAVTRRCRRHSWRCLIGGGSAHYDVFPPFWISSGFFIIIIIKPRGDFLFMNFSQNHFWRGAVKISKKNKKNKNRAPVVVPLVWIENQHIIIRHIYYNMTYNTKEVIFPAVAIPGEYHRLR